MSPLLLLAWSTPSFASGEAEEAEVTFQLGARAYVASSYDEALAWFLASNRLAPNPSVAFNIARCYARLGRNAEAWRWLDIAGAGLDDPKVQAAITAEKAVVGPEVVIWEITSDPPGAEVFVDRKELGSVGVTPLSLALAPNEDPLAFFLEKEGHRSATAQGEPHRRGSTGVIRSELPMIVGTVRFDGEAGATVHQGGPEGPVLCVAPCVAKLPPGNWVLYFRREGYRDAVRQLVVEADQELTATVPLVPDTGSLVVDTTERGAKVEVDGTMVGFTPTVVQGVAVGTRKVRISLTGYEPVERDVLVETDAQVNLSAVELLPLDQVSAVSRRVEDIALAPSSVTVIGTEELRAFRYPTLYEALRGVRGVSLTFDSIYGSAAVRGLGQQNDFGNRLLVQSDSATLNDNLLFQSFITYDGRVDLGGVERIEVVRGPGSVLYGTGAVSGVVNMVGESNDSPVGSRVSVGAYDDAVVRGRAETHVRFGDDGDYGFRASVSGAGSQGTALEADPRGPAPAVELRGYDAFRAGTTTGRLWAKSATLQWFHTGRRIDIPTGVYGTILGNEGGRNEWTDERTMLELRVEPELSETTTLLTRAWFNRYHYEGVLPYAGYTSAEVYDVLSAGGEARVVIEPSEAVRMQVGGLVDATPSLTLSGEDQLPDGTATPYLDATAPYTIAAGYVLADLAPIPELRITAGGRADWWSTFGVAVSPRLAVVAVPDEGDVVKLMAGRAFRAPSIYELQYTIPGVQVAPQDLGPETVWSGELEYSHDFGPLWTGLVAGHASLAQNLIESVGAATAGAVTYENSDLDIRILGGDAEVRRTFQNGFLVSAFYSLLDSRYTDGVRVPNVPLHAAGTKLIVPIVLPEARVAFRNSLEAPRRIDGTSDATTGWAVVSDLVLSGGVPERRFDYAVGVYNLFDMNYVQPLGDTFPFRTMPQRGRSLMATLSLGF